MNLPKSRRGLLLSLSNTRNPDAASGINPPSQITDCEGNRLFGRDMQRTKNSNYLSPTHNSEGLRATLENSYARGSDTMVVKYPYSFDISTFPQDETASRDFVTSLQSNVCGVARTSRIFSAIHSQNDRNYRMKSPKNASAGLEFGGKMSTEAKITGGGETRVIFSADGRWSTFFSEDDLRNQTMLRLSTEPTADSEGVDALQATSPRIRTSSTFQSDGMSRTMNWRSAIAQKHRARKSFPHSCESSSSGPIRFGYSKIFAIFF